MLRHDANLKGPEKGLTVDPNPYDPEDQSPSAKSPLMQAAKAHSRSVSALFSHWKKPLLSTVWCPQQSLVPQKSNEDVLNTRGKVFMVALALQYGWQPLLTKECIGADVQKSSIVIFQEVFKLFLSFTMLFMEGGWSKWTDALANANGPGNHTPLTLLGSAHCCCRTAL